MYIYVYNYICKHVQIIETSSLVYDYIFMNTCISYFTYNANVSSGTNMCICTYVFMFICISYNKKNAYLSADYRDF
jgi:hypothetical protein